MYRTLHIFATTSAAMSYLKEHATGLDCWVDYNHHAWEVGFHFHQCVVIRDSHDINRLFGLGRFNHIDCTQASHLSERVQDSIVSIAGGHNSEEPSMENQHRQIKGYRDLDQNEINAMNQIKLIAEQVGAMVELMESNPDLDQRWVAVGKTQAQQAFMALTRAVAQPETF